MAKNARPVFSHAKDETQPEKEAPIVLGAFWTVLPMRWDDFAWPALDSRTRKTPLVGWNQRLGEFGSRAREMRNLENSKGNQGTSQGKTSSREALWRKAIKAAYGWIKG
jgi:hypothetical protein